MTKCKYIDCENYHKDATTYCTQGCACDDYDWHRISKWLDKA